ncbi:hypothetical protein Vretimale_18558 [Volvox reticuliferus]|uniref:Ubiquitin-like protease family profile domain-containing protein n=1 Tax=Volvox reticuliferus TaxID=1737510 RepID=A0A8J4GXJ3_9CHLO|nr:hypothetical protein Vretimale_18558 [Volvox reticuliferus]
MRKTQRKRIAEVKVLDYHDVLLREQDVSLLEGPHWLNDQVVAFYFEYLSREGLGGDGRGCVAPTPEPTPGCDAKSPSWASAPATTSLQQQKQQPQQRTVGDVLLLPPATSFLLIHSREACDSMRCPEGVERAGKDRVEGYTGSITSFMLMRLSAYPSALLSCISPTRKVMALLYNRFLKHSFFNNTHPTATSAAHDLLAAHLTTIVIVVIVVIVAIVAIIVIIAATGAITPPGTPFQWAQLQRWRLSCWLP